MGVTVDHFAAAIAKLAQTAAGKETLEQILAVDDFCSFKRMMAKRNRELELEALKALEELSRQSAAAADAGATGNSFASEEEEEEAMIQRAIKESMAEAGLTVKAVDVEAKQREKEEADLRTAIALSLQIEEQAQAARANMAELEPDPTPTAAAEVAKPAPAELEARLSAAGKLIEQSSGRAAAILPLPKVKELAATGTAEKPGAQQAAAVTPQAQKKAAKEAEGGSDLCSLASLPALRTTNAPSLQVVKATEAIARAAEARVRAEEEKERERRLHAASPGMSDVAKIQAQEMEARAAHLRKQRDLILAQRKREREMAMAEAQPASAAQAAADAGVTSIDSHRANLARALAMGMKSQLAGGNTFGLEGRRADLEATKAALKAEYGT
eukprot:scaffold134613_cov30-Tisochrysis_lutea.AAC.2